jgi:diguanylate cyclase (GGDEF)-like protein
VEASARTVIRELARRRPDPYAGASLENTRRFAGALWGVAVLVVAVLLPIFPPDQAIGAAAGWALTLPILTGLAGAVWYLARRPTLVTFSVHLVAAYLCAFLLAVLQWLAGGWHAPYHELLLALALGNALTHPPRRFAPLMVAIWISALAPLAYAGDHSALASVLVSLLLWTGMSCFCLVLMFGIRAHRIGLTAKGEAAERMARVDALTGLENRRAFDEAFPRALARGRATGEPLTLVLADLDDFKRVNDRHGHLAGDAVLTAVGAALRLHARATDRAFRWAGDEFAVLLEDTDEQTAAQVCSRLREAITRAVTTPGGEPVTVTLGWARDEGGGTLEDLTAAADRAMLARKRSGRRVGKVPADDGGDEAAVQAVAPFVGMQVDARDEGGAGA